MPHNTPALPVDAPAGTLHALAYASTAAREMGDEELSRLMDNAQASNRRHDITGMLLYSGGSFMQVLEGPPDALRQAYTRIHADNRHFGLIKLLDEPVRQREFAGWSMGYGRILPAELAQLSSASGSTLRSMMANFWLNNRR